MEATTDTETLLERPALADLPVEHLFDMKVELEPAQNIETAVGNRMTFVVKGGPIDGPKLKGELLPGGGDWLTVGTDLAGRVDIRATIRTDDGALIHYTALGIIKVPPQALARLANGERISIDESYIRTTPRFETSDERYSWLSEVVAASYNELVGNKIGGYRIDYRIYRIL
jgi:Protein of unknown function (DUF3237)